LGNRNNSVVIGLSATGKDLIDYIKVNQDIPEVLNNEQKALFDEMMKHGFINNSYEQKDYIDSAYIHLNSKCNLHCLGCYSYIEDRNSKVELSLDDWKMFIDQLSECGVRNLVISGGEPFLRPDIKEICEYIRSKGIETLEIITNGTLDTDKYLPVLPLIDALNVSIDGYNDESSFIRDKGIMPKVIANVKKLRDLVPIKLIVTLHKKNIEFMKQYEKLAKDLKVFMSYSIFTVDFEDELFKDFSFIDEDFLRIGDNITNSERYMPIMDTPNEDVGLNYREGCGMGKNIVSIAYNGEVYPCHMLQCDECSMGNLKRNSLKISLIKRGMKKELKLMILRNAIPVTINISAGEPVVEERYFIRETLSVKIRTIWLLRNSMIIFSQIIQAYNI